VTPREIHSRTVPPKPAFVYRFVARCQFDRPGRAMKKPDAEAGFKTAYGTAYGGLSNAQSFCRLDEAARLHHCDKCADSSEDARVCGHADDYKSYMYWHTCISGMFIPGVL